MKGLLDVKHWDLLAVIAASIAGLVLHALGVLPEAYLISLILFLLCLHAIHELGHGMKYEEAHGEIMGLKNELKKPEPEIELIATSHFSAGEEFALRNRGVMWWFNTPLGVLRSQEVFDKLLKSAIENPKTKRVEFILRHGLKAHWEKEVQPKIEKCAGKEKVAPPMWRDIKENVGFKMIDLSETEDVKEAHLTVWGEPFTMEHEADIYPKVYHPRFILHVKKRSELIPHLKELFLKYRMQKEI